MSYKIKGEVEIAKGLGLPLLTSAEIAAYSPPKTGYIVYDTDLDALYKFDGTAWKSVNTGEPVTLAVAQAAHGLVVGDVANTSGIKYNRNFQVAQDTGVYGVVSEVVDANNIVLTLNGRVSITGLGFTPHFKVYSDSTGNLTNTPDDTVQNLLVGIVSTTEEIFVAGPVTLETLDISQPQATATATGATLDIDLDLVSNMQIGATTGTTTITHNTSVAPNRIRILMLESNLATGTTFSFDPIFKQGDGVTNIPDVTIFQDGTRRMYAFVSQNTGGFRLLFSTETIETPVGDIRNVNQVGHGFTLGEYVTDVAGTWTSASRSDLPNYAETSGIVTETADLDNFVVTVDGIATVPAHGYTTNALLYTDITSGGLTSTRNDEKYQWVAGYVIDANTISVSPFNIVEDERSAKTYATNSATPTFANHNAALVQAGAATGTVNAPISLTDVDGDLVWITLEGDVASGGTTYSFAAGAYKNQDDSNIASFLVPAGEKDIFGFIVNGTSLTKVYSSTVPPAPIADHTQETINQTTHGFVVTQPVYHDGTDWKAAVGNTDASAAQAIVTQVIDGNNFIITTHGVVTATGHGLNVGEYYWLDQTVSAVTATQPVNAIAQSLLHVRDANTLFIDVEQAAYITAPTTIEDVETLLYDWVTEGETDLSSTNRTVTLPNGVTWQDIKDTYEYFDIQIKTNVHGNGERFHVDLIGTSESVEISKFGNRYITILFPADLSLSTFDVTAGSITLQDMEIRGVKAQKTLIPAKAVEVDVSTAVDGDSFEWDAATSKMIPQVLTVADGVTAAADIVQTTALAFSVSTGTNPGTGAFILNTDFSGYHQIGRIRYYTLRFYLDQDVAFKFQVTGASDVFNVSFGNGYSMGSGDFAARQLQVIRSGVNEITIDRDNDSNIDMYVDVTFSAFMA